MAFGQDYVAPAPTNIGRGFGQDNGGGYVASPAPAQSLETTVQDAGTAMTQAGGMQAQAEQQWKTLADKLANVSPQDRLRYIISTGGYGALPGAAGRGLLTWDAIAPYGELVRQAQDAASKKDQRQTLQGLGAVAGPIGGWALGLGAPAAAEVGASGLGPEAIEGGVDALSGGAAASMPAAVAPSMPAAVVNTGASGLMPAAIPEAGGSLSNFGSAAGGVPGGAVAGAGVSANNYDPYASTPDGGDPSLAGGGEVGSGYPAASDPNQAGGIWDDIKKLMQSGATKSNLTQARDGLGLAGGLVGLINANSANKKLNEMIQNNQPSPGYDYSQNWDLVNQYMSDPMSVIKNNPGYLASVDYITGQEGRKAAGLGQTNSGNRVYNTANALGSNAEKWYNDMWTPIRESAGLQRPDQSANLMQTQTQALGQIQKTKNDAVSDIFNAGSSSLPSIFKWLG